MFCLPHKNGYRTMQYGTRFSLSFLPAAFERSALPFLRLMPRTAACNHKYCRRHGGYRNALVEPFHSIAQPYFVPALVYPYPDTAVIHIVHIRFFAVHISAPAFVVRNAEKHNILFFKLDLRCKSVARLFTGGSRTPPSVLNQPFIFVIRNFFSCRIAYICKNIGKDGRIAYYKSL